MSSGASLGKTPKFWSWKIKNSDVSAASALAIGLGKRVSLDDIVQVAANEKLVRCEFTSDVVEGVSIAPLALYKPTTLNTPVSENQYYPQVFGRAALFARAVEMIQGKSSVRKDLISSFIVLLNARVVPCFSSQSKAGQELVAALAGAEGSYCYTERGIMTSSLALKSYGITIPQMSKDEAATIAAGAFFSVGVGSLITAGAVNLSNTADGVASLSCEAFCAPLEPFDTAKFELYRQQRGQISSAANLRFYLEGSRRVNNPTASNVDALRAFATIPQTTGPASEYISIASRALEIELNSLDESTAKDAYGGFDPTQALLSVQSVVSSLDKLCEASVARTLVLKGGNEYCASCATAPVSSDVLLNSHRALERFREALSDEVATALSHLPVIEGSKVDDASVLTKDKEAKSLKPEIDDSNLTPEQRAKAEAKRKQKAEKAAQKAAVKESKKSGSNGTAALGIGTERLRSEILKRTASRIDRKTISTLLDPYDVSADGLGKRCVMILEQLAAGSSKRRPKIAKGARDFTPDQMRIREQAFGAIRRVFKRHGGVEIDTPVFELKEILTGKYGEDSKLIYDLVDQGGELLSLRYDLTVPFARFLAMNSVGNIKRFHIAKVYRRDQPQLARGRYREFYQCDFDVAGSYAPMVADAEVITVAAEILTDLPVGSFLIKLNHRKILDAIFEICGVPTEKFRPICSAVDKLDKAPWSEVKEEMIKEKGLASGIADKIGDFVLNSGSPKVLWEQLDTAKKFGTHAGAVCAMEDLRILFNYLEAMGSLQYVSFDLSLARGLDYYTGVIYEVVLTDGTSQVGSIAAGGRYDNLVGMFSTSGVQTPCVGVSIGIERVFTIMEKKAKDANVLQASNIQVYIASIGAGLVPQRMRVARFLWDANISAEYSHQDNPKFKKQLDEVLERGVPFMVVLGEEELARQTVKVKDMRSHSEDEVALSEVVQFLLSKGCVPVAAGVDLDMLKIMKSSPNSPSVED